MVNGNTKSNRLQRWYPWVIVVLVGVLFILSALPPTLSFDWPLEFLIHPDDGMLDVIDGLSTNPIEPPDGIWVSPSPGSTMKNRDELCVNILYGFDPDKHFGDPGHGYRAPEAWISVDGSHLPVVYSLPLDMGLRDGMSVSSALFCFRFTLLRSGPHLFRIETYSYRGEPIDYSWVWTVK